MKSIVPYTKEISFGSKIAEITSMSLEHELEIGAEELKGNFIISGDYKSHEVSINREPFLYKLPFSMDITDGIDLNSIKFEITDFSYDIISDDTVSVDIEFSVDAEEKEQEERSIFEKVEDPVAQTEDLTTLMEDITPIAEEDIEEENSVKERTEERVIMPSATPEIVIAKKEETIESLKESEETIIKSVNPTDDSFATYHIHIVKDGENVETICTMYHSNLNLLSEYNDMSNVSIGDKIIIPKEDE